MKDETISGLQKISPFAVKAGDLIWLCGVVVAFLSACFFYGVGTNLVFILPVLMLPAVAVSVVSKARLATLLEGNRALVSVALGSLAALVFHQFFFSLSPDSSFGPSLILAMLPLWALLAVVYRRRDLLLNAVFAVVFVFAAISAWDYTTAGQRAHAPMWDPNNYVSLLYLAWIPWLFNRFGSAPLNLSSYAWTFAGCAVFSLALLAAHSRFAMLVVAGVAVGGIIFCLWFRLQSKHAVVALLGVLLASGIYIGLDQGGISSAIGVSAGSRADTPEGGYRWLMLEAAFNAIRDMGGVNGTGLYTFSLLYPMYRSPLEQNTGGVFVHNDFVQLFLEGGLWLTLPLLILCVCVLVVGFKIALSRRWDSRVALVLAISCAMVHANVNYVFYVLPLTVVLGLYVGLLFVSGADTQFNSTSAEKSQRQGLIAASGKWLFVALVSLNGFYLCTDALTLGVFSNQLHVPGAAQIRSDNLRMLSYARSAQTINDRRPVPLLGEAMLLETNQSSHTRQELIRIDLAYQRAIEKDPWNTMGYVSRARFLLRHAEGLGPVAQQEALSQLRYAQQLDPASVEPMALMIAISRQQGALTEALQMSRSIMQWCELIKRRGVPASHLVFRQMNAVAAASGDQQLGADIEACMARQHTSAASGRNPTRMMRWLRSFSYPDS